MSRSLGNYLGKTPLAIASLFVVGFVLAPLAAMLWGTIYDKDTGSLSLSPWSQILADPIDRAQLAYSLQLGFAATSIAGLLGMGHAWLTQRTDLPLGRLLGPLGVLPLIVPPIFVAMAFGDFLDLANKGAIGARAAAGIAPGARPMPTDVSGYVDFAGFWPCAALLGVCYAPFVAVLCAAGMRSIDGRQYEAALIARGRGPAERLLLRSVWPEIAAGLLLAFVFVVSEHGVPEFLTVKGKTWHTYAEGIFSKWNRRALGTGHDHLASPIVAAVPLVATIGVALWLALRLRARATVTGDHQPLPIRRLGRLRWPALFVPSAFLTAGVIVPIIVMARWAMGSTNLRTPTSIDQGVASLRQAFELANEELVNTMTLGGLAVVILIAIAVPLAWAAARGRRWVEYVAVVPIAVPAILLAIGILRVYNVAVDGKPLFGDFAVGSTIVGCAYAARLLPFAVLTLATAARRVPRELDEAAQLTGRSPVARALGVRLPLLMPAILSAACLIFVLALRELDVAVVFQGGNATVVRKLSNVVHFGGEDLGGALALLLLGAAILGPALTMLITGRKLRSLS